ncbi:MAG: DUF4386 domain-containing protein [Bacteroidetes bacterium]|nr:MAG: DUF4386 domain-containing protein [Bacteroidota bacterium]
MTPQLSDQSANAYARIAGVLYLVIIVCGLFSEMFVRANIIVPGDARATAANILASEPLYRLGFASDLVMILCDIGVAMLFYMLFRPVSQALALLAAFFRLVQSAVLGVNLLNHFVPLLLLGGDPYLAGFETGQMQTMSLLFLQAHGYGYLISGMFFGLSCLILGYLFYHSVYFPKALGILLVLASLGYLIDGFTNFLAPDFAEVTEWLVVLSAVIAEISICLWLLIKGARKSA